MAIVRGRDIKEVKRELSDIDNALKCVTNEIDDCKEYIIDASAQILEIRDEIDSTKVTQENKKKELSTLLTQYLQVKKQLDYMTGNEDQSKPWEKDRPHTERSLLTFGGKSA
ncbi:MAG: hypothetical protein GQ576_00395 [Methanococcoides sp.]|nr:hypothetical protein [Methanococcoides sp.]